MKKVWIVFNSTLNTIEKVFDSKEKAVHYAKTTTRWDDVALNVKYYIIEKVVG